MLPLALLLVAACDRFCDEPIADIPLPKDQIDVFEQKPASRVDILWMIDNSGSMAAEQTKIAARFNDFFNQLITSQVDYHIGVVTSDPAEGGILRQYPQAAPDVAGCVDCRYVSKDIECPNPAVSISATDSEAEIEATLADECPAQLVFRKLIQAGTDGSPFEEGFRVAAMALGADVIDPTTGFPVKEPPPENEGFLREDASLFIIFVSDEDEGAKTEGTPIRYYQRLFEGLKSAGNENKVSVSAITGWPFQDGLPTMDELCPILQSKFDSNAGNDDARYSQVLPVLQNPTGNLCIDQSAGGDDENAFAEAGARYIELACRTGGVVSNMCEEDYSTALDKLGANAAGLLRKFPISRPTELEAGRDCVPFTEDDGASRLDCNEDGDLEDECVDEVICVKATPLTPDGPGAEALIPRCDPNDDTKPDLWTYEPGTSSVRFEGNFIPAPGTTVTVRYPLAPETRTCN
jgi:hypothetical protein